MIAVSVAQATWRDIVGRQVFTSIMRTASDRPVYFAAGGPDGNATAVHTEEVFAYFAEHYDHWAKRLGIDRSAWSTCYWGENLMLSGLPDEAALHIGDRLRVGEALLEVTSPRIPCFKLSWRLGQSEGFLRDLIQSGRLGCYLRVIEPGLIEQGDVAVRETVAENAISVLALSRLLHDTAVDDLDVLRRASGTPGLGGQAAGMLRKRIAHLTDARLAAKGRWQGWRRFEIASVTTEAKDIRSFRLRPADGGPIGGYRAGQHLTVRLPNGLVRSWSLSDYDQAATDYRVSIRRESLGAGSGWMHDTAQVGDVVDVRPPSGRFVLDRSGFMRTVLISAGIGVTPMIAMLKAHAERLDEAPPLLWLHVSRSGEAHAFAAEVDALLAAIPNARRRTYYSSPGSTDALGFSHDRQGRPGSEAISEMLTESYTLSPFGRRIELTGDYSDFYLCGPKAFEDAVRKALVAHGLDAEAIRSESFGGRDSLVDGPPLPVTSKVFFPIQQRIAIWRRDDSMTLLELAESEGIAVEHACRTGNCGSCEVSLVRGTVRYLVTPAAKPVEGRVLLCCTQPNSDELELTVPIA